MWMLVIAIVFGVTGTVTSAGLYVRLRRALRALDRRSMGLIMLGLLLRCPRHCRSGTGLRVLMGLVPSESGGVHTGIQFSSLQTNESLEMGA